jgi:hypothetical protein
VLLCVRGLFENRPLILKKESKIWKGDKQVELAARKWLRFHLKLPNVLGSQRSLERQESNKIGHMLEIKVLTVQKWISILQVHAY